MPGLFRSSSLEERSRVIAWLITQSPGGVSVWSRDPPGAWCALLRFILGCFSFPPPTVEYLPREDVQPRPRKITSDELLRRSKARHLEADCMSEALQKKETFALRMEQRSPSPDSLDFCGELRIMEGNSQWGRFTTFLKRLQRRHQRLRLSLRIWFEQTWKRGLLESLAFSFLFFFFCPHSSGGGVHHHDETRRDRPTVGSPAAVDAYKDKTRQLLKAGCVEISGSGRQVAQQRGREGGRVGG